MATGVTNDILSPFDIEQQESLLAIIAFLEGRRLAGDVVFPHILYWLFFGFDIFQAQALTDYFRSLWNNLTPANLPIGFDEGQQKVFRKMIPALIVSIGGERDPQFSNVVSLLHMNGIDASTTFTDVKGKVWTPTGAAQIDTADKQFGTGSMLVGASLDYISTPAHADFGFGANSFTVEMWYKRTGTLVNAFLADFRVAGGNSFMMWAAQGGVGHRLGYSNEGGASFVSSTQALSAGQWYHLAITREMNAGVGTVRGFVDGQIGFTTTDSRTFASPQGVYLGSSTSASQAVNGWIDEFRVTKNVARYTANFTPPTAPFLDQ